MTDHDDLHGRPERDHPQSGPDDPSPESLDPPGRPVSMRAFFATTITASLLVWDLAFALGAYHTVFYSRLFQILIVSTVLLLGSIVLRHDVNVRPWMRVPVAIPLVWFTVHSIEPVTKSTGAVHTAEQVLIGLALASVPFTLWALARIVAPDYFELRARRVRALAVAIIVLVAVGGFLVGQFNPHFTTCHDYVVAGDNQPSNCRPTPGTPAPTP